MMGEGDIYDGGTGWLGGRGTAWGEICKDEGRSGFQKGDVIRYSHLMMRIVWRRISWRLPTLISPAILISAVLQLHLGLKYHSILDNTLMKSHHLLYFQVLWIETLKRNDQNHLVVVEQVGHLVIPRHGRGSSSRTQIVLLQGQTNWIWATTVCCVLSTVCQHLHCGVLCLVV